MNAEPEITQRESKDFKGGESKIDLVINPNLLNKERSG